MSTPEALRLLFFGTPDFAVPVLRALAAGPHPVVGVVSQPDRPSGRGRKLRATPVREEAEQLRLPVLQPEKVGDASAREWMVDLEPDLGCVVAFGQFIPKSVRELPRHGLINAHGSLLPRHRGAAPIQHAILAGDAQTGISVMRIAKEMDAGDWCLKRELSIGADETAGELSERLAALAAESLVEAVQSVAEGRARFHAQDPALVTFAPKVDRDFARLDFGEPAERVLRRIRAATPWPGVWVTLRKSGKRFRIERAVRPASAPQGAESGAVLVSDGALLISCADGWVAIERLQVAGKRAVTCSEFLRGARIADDEEVEPEPRP